MSRLRTLAATLFLSASPALLSAQTSPFIGDWSVEVTAGMRIENDEPTPIRAKARLSIVAKGDSLVATLVVDPIPDTPPRPPATFATARVPGSEIRFVQRSQATLNMNGDERQATVVSTWTLKVDGDTISGIVAREIEGMMGPGMPPQPVSGTRVKQ